MAALRRKQAQQQLPLFCCVRPDNDTGLPSRANSYLQRGVPAAAAPQAQLTIGPSAAHLLALSRAAIREFADPALQSLV